MKTIGTALRILIAFPIFCIWGIYFGLYLLILGDGAFTKVKPIGRVMLWILGAKMTLEGRYPKEGQFIVMFNHVSFIELFLLVFVVDGRKVSGITAKKNMQIPVIGALFRLLKVIPVNARGKEQAIALIRQAEEVMKDGCHYVLSPEGTRSVTGKLGPLKKGGFYLAINTQIPILPVGFEGTFDYKPKNRSYIQPGLIHARIGKPIEVEGLTEKNIDELVAKVAESLRRLSGEE